MERFLDRRRPPAVRNVPAIGRPFGDAQGHHGATIECYDSAQARKIGETVLIELQKGVDRAP